MFVAGGFAKDLRRCREGPANVPRKSHEASAKVSQYCRNGGRDKERRGEVEEREAKGRERMVRRRARERGERGRESEGGGEE